MKTISKYAASFLVALTGLTVALPANALPTLRITQGTNVQTVTDNGAGDFVPIDGFVFFLGTVGTYDVNVSAYTKPYIGTAQSPNIDVLSAQFSTSGAASEVVIEFSETDFNNTAQTITLPSSIGGTTSGSVRYQTYASASNALFARDILLADSGTMMGSLGDSFSFDAYASFALNGDYSLTTVMTINHGNGTRINSSFNATVEIPEPALISLTTLSGLMFIAGLSARRRQRRR